MEKVHKLKKMAQGTSNIFGGGLDPLDYTHAHKANPIHQHLKNAPKKLIEPMI
jgi:hypothetical protein